MRWAEIKVEAVAGSEDAVSNILTEEGCAGTAVYDNSDVVGYLPVDDRLENALRSIRDRVGGLPRFGLELRSEDISVTWVEEEEWATAWKQFFKPIRIGRVVIKPTWEEFTSAKDDVVVDIDPGMAFGTGYHPTTRMCLTALQDMIKGGESVLDVGTGSGILAMAAAKLGAGKVVGLDIDPVAVKVAAENIENSNLEKQVSVCLASSPAEYGEKADIVVANIIARVIADMAEELSAKVAPGGRLITSGIVRERSNEVLDAVTNAGMRLIKTLDDGEWVALVFEPVE